MYALRPETAPLTSLGVPLDRPVLPCCISTTVAAAACVCALPQEGERDDPAVPQEVAGAHARFPLFFQEGARVRLAHRGGRPQAMWHRQVSAILPAGRRTHALPPPHLHSTCLTYTHHPPHRSADDLTNRQFSFTVQVPERNYYLVAASDGERNEWVAAIGRATTESRRVRSYSEEVHARASRAHDPPFLASTH